MGVIGWLWAARIPHSPHSSSTVGAQKPRSDRGGTEKPPGSGRWQPGQETDSKSGVPGTDPAQFPTWCQGGGHPHPSGTGQEESPLPPPAPAGSWLDATPPHSPGAGHDPGASRSQTQLPGELGASTHPAPAGAGGTRASPPPRPPPAARARMRRTKKGRGCGAQAGRCPPPGQTKGPPPAGSAAPPPAWGRARRGPQRTAHPRAHPPTQRPCLPSRRGEQPLGGSFSPGRGGASGVILSFPARLHPSHHPPRSRAQPGTCQALPPPPPPQGCCERPKRGAPAARPPRAPQQRPGEGWGRESREGAQPAAPLLAPPVPLQRNPRARSRRPAGAAQRPVPRQRRAQPPPASRRAPPRAPGHPRSGPRRRLPGTATGGCAPSERGGPGSDRPRAAAAAPRPQPLGVCVGGHRSPGSGCRAPRPAPPPGTPEPPAGGHHRHRERRSPGQQRQRHRRRGGRRKEKKTKTHE